MITDSEVDRILVETQRMAERLSELGCDSVAVFITLPLKGGFTGSRAIRRGNYWAQMGQVQGWLDNQKQEDQADALADALELSGDDDDSESWKGING